MSLDFRSASSWSLTVFPPENNHCTKLFLPALTIQNLMHFRIFAFSNHEGLGWVRFWIFNHIALILLHASYRSESSWSIIEVSRVAARCTGPWGELKTRQTRIRSRKHGIGCRRIDGVRVSMPPSDPKVGYWWPTCIRDCASVLSCPVWVFSTNLIVVALRVGVIWRNFSWKYSSHQCLLTYFSTYFCVPIVMSAGGWIASLVFG